VCFIFFLYALLDELCKFRGFAVQAIHKKYTGHYEVSTKDFPINLSSIFNKLVIEIKELGDIAGFDLYQKYAAKNGIKINYFKKRVNYTINKHTIDRFKIVADKDMRKMSNIVENLIRRYLESRV
jgi:hypothetical protein